MWGSCALWAVLLLSAAGCTAPQSTIEIVDYRNPGRGLRYRETFDESYYGFDDRGNVDIILRRSHPGTDDPGENVTQVIHIHCVWRSIPGRTVADRTQINAAVRYMVSSGATGATFEGAGSVFFKQNRRGDALRGTLECASLKPKRRLAGTGSFFERAELSGQIRAKRDRRRVVRIINDMKRLFGPPPR